MNERERFLMTARSERPPAAHLVTDRRGRAIGKIEGDVYIKVVTQPAQILRSPRGYGFDAWAMETQVLPRVRWIAVDNRCEGRVDRCSVAEFRRSCISIDRGAGRQYVLPLDYWQRQTASPADIATKPAEEAPRQGRLEL